MSGPPQFLQVLASLKYLGHHIWVGVPELGIEQVLVHRFLLLGAILNDYSIHSDLEVLRLVRERSLLLIISDGRRRVVHSFKLLMLPIWLTCLLEALVLARELLTAFRDARWLTIVSLMFD